MQHRQVRTFAVVCSHNQTSILKQNHWFKMMLFISFLHNTDFEMANSFHVHMSTHTICVCLHKLHNCLDYVVRVYHSFYLL